MFVPRYGHIRTSKFGVGLSERQSNFTLFASKTGGSDYVRMGLFASIYGSYYLVLIHATRREQITLADEDLCKRRHRSRTDTIASD